MLKRLIQWFKNFFQRLFGSKQPNLSSRNNSPSSPPPPLSDTDLEFLFAELLEGVHQARGQAWAEKWLQNIQHRVTQERWLEWLKKFGDKLLAAPTPNNELASRLVQLGELGVGEVSNVAYDIGMRLLTRNQAEPILEYDGPDTTIEPAIDQNGSNSTQNGDWAVNQEDVVQENSFQQVEATEPNASEAEGEYQTITLEELMDLMQEDLDLRAQIAQQLGIETDDPEVIIQTLVNQYNAAG